MDVYLGVESDDAPQVPEEVVDTLLHRTLLAHNPSISEEEYFSMTESTSKNNRNQTNRKLGAFEDFQKFASQTYWCGSEYDLEAPCPDDKKWWPYDYEADHACRRHDHGKKSEKTKTFGLYRMECLVDKALKDAGGHHWAINAFYGDEGVMGWLIGCWSYEGSICWDLYSWSPYTCNKRWVLAFGKYRYYHFAAEMKDGYKKKKKTCEGDLGGYYE